MNFPSTLGRLHFLIAGFTLLDVPLMELKDTSLIAHRGDVHWVRRALPFGPFPPLCKRACPNSQADGCWVQIQIETLQR